jgi:hypothetical protein
MKESFLSSEEDFKKYHLVTGTLKQMKKLSFFELTVIY